MVEDEKEDRWYFTREILTANSPSRRHGYDADKELSCRQQAANLIQDMGQKLQVSQLCINTAIVYMHRFYMFHSLQAFPRNNIAAAALFLAAKVEEQPRKVEHVLKVAHLCLHRDSPSSLDVKSEAYQEQASELTLNESIILQTLGFDVAIDHPHTHVVRCCQLVKASKDLAQTSYFMASNSLHLTTMCLQYKPTVVACFCIHLACKWSNWEIPRSNEGKDWFWYVNQSVTLELLEQMTSEFLIIFDKCPTKLKKKMMSMNQSNPVNFGAPVGGPQENYHFDEPRKLMGAEANRPPEGFAQMQQQRTERPPHASTSNTQQHSSATSVPAPAAPHLPRHVDYKEYKEKRERERADRDRLQREGYHMQHPGVHPQPTSHPVPKTDKIKAPVPPTGQQLPAQPQPLPHRSSTSATAHKIYPPQHHPQPQLTTQQQQTRMHVAPTSSKDSHHSSHPARLPVKEAIKRKYEEIDITGDYAVEAGHQKNVDYRHKVLPHYAMNYQGQTVEGHTQKDSSQNRDKTNIQYQRPADKYPSANRPQQPPTLQKSHREEKKYEELPSLDGDQGMEWHQKHGQAPHGMDRYSGGVKPMTVPHQQIQQSTSREAVFKHHSQQGAIDASQKHNLLVPGSASVQHPSAHPTTAHKRHPEKIVDKQSTKLVAPPHKLPVPLVPEGSKQKTTDVKKVPGVDPSKKEKTPQKHKPSASHAPMHHQQPHQQQAVHHHQPSLFDMPDIMDIDSDVVSEPPAKVQKVGDTRMFDRSLHPGASRKPKSKSELSHPERKDDKKKDESHATAERYEDRKRMEAAFADDRKRTDPSMVIDRKRTEIPVVDERKRMDIAQADDRKSLEAPYGEDRKRVDAAMGADRKRLEQHFVEERKRMDALNEERKRLDGAFVADRKRTEAGYVEDRKRMEGPFVDERKRVESLFGDERKRPEGPIVDDRKRLDGGFGEDRKSAGVLTEDRKRMEVPFVDDRKRVDASFAEERTKTDAYCVTDATKQTIVDSTKPKSFSIFSPDINEQHHQNVIVNYDKEQRSKNDLVFGTFPKKSSSLFSPPPTQSHVSHRGSAIGSREGVILTAPQSSRPEKEKRSDERAFDPMLNKPELAYKRPEPSSHGKVPPQMPNVNPKAEPPGYAMMGNVMQTHAPTLTTPPVSLSHQQLPTAVSAPRHSSIQEAGAVIFAAEKPSFAVQEMPPKIVSPVSTVNLMNMGDMVDTRTNVAAVIKPLPHPRSEVPVIKPPPVKEEKILDEKVRPATNEVEIKHGERSERKKSKNKDRDRSDEKDGHRHKEKKKSDGKKEKKKHKDKDRERKKDSHRDKDKSDRSNAPPVQQIPPATSLKITIPKEKIPEMAGLKLKISKERTGEAVVTSKPVAMETGSLKITIKKEDIVNYKDDRKSSKKKDKESSHSHHKSKSSKADKGDKSESSSHKSGKSSSGSKVSSK